MFKIALWLSRKNYHRENENAESELKCGAEQIVFNSKIISIWCANSYENR